MIAYDIDLLIGQDNPDKGLAVKCHDTGINLRCNLKKSTVVSKYRKEEKSYTIPAGSMVVLKIAKADKTYVLQDGKACGSVAYFACNPQTFTAAGMASAEVSVYGSDGLRITSATFEISVIQEVGNDCEKDSRTYVDILAEQRKAVEEAVKRAEEAAKKAEEASGSVTPGGGAKAARIGFVTLLASAWEGKESLYSQVVDIDGVTENSQVDLTPDVQQLAVFYEKDLTFVTENEGGVVTVYAIGQMPQNDYTIQVTITEVEV